MSEALAGTALAVIVMAGATLAIVVLVDWIDYRRRLRRQARRIRGIAAGD